MRLMTTQPPCNVKDALMVMEGCKQDPLSIMYDDEDDCCWIAIL